MKKIILVLAAITVMILAEGQNLMADSLYPVEGTNSLYTEKRARRVGDVITDLIEETNQAVNSASSQDKKSAGIVAGAGTGFYGTGYYGSNVLSSNTNGNIGIG